MTTQTQHSTQDIARTLVEKCRHGKNMEVMKELYDKNIVSIEAMAQPGHPTEYHGLDDVLKKSEDWLSQHEIHSVEVSEPLVANNEFAVMFTMDVTNKQMQKRMTMKEIGVYQMHGGKIIREQFFYS